MYKTNEYYVEEIIKNLDFISNHMDGVTQEALEADEVLTDSMVFRLIQFLTLQKI